MLNHTLAGLFATQREAEAAIDGLKEKGVLSTDISVLVQEGVVHVERKTAGESVLDRAGTGTATGAAMGGLLGLLVGVGALAIPGVGALFIAGPIASGLGLAGVAATTVSGAVSGALAGGFLGALMGLGLSKEDAELYETRLKAGDVLVAVTTRDAIISEKTIRDVLEAHGARELRTLQEKV
jgi:uncharacterized membrane protein